MSNAGQDDVDRALAAAGVPAMRYFNFRNLRFVRSSVSQPVEVLGVNAADLNLHDISPPGLEPSQAATPVEVVAEPPLEESRPVHVEPHFGYEPIPTEVVPSVVGVPEVAAEQPASQVVAEATSVDHRSQPAHATAEPETSPLMAQLPSEPARIEPEPPAESLVAAETASLPPTSPPPVDPPPPPPPAPPPPEFPAPPTLSAEPPPPDVDPPVDSSPEPLRAPAPVAAPNHPVARETSARVVETEAPVFDVEPDAAVAPPVAPIDAPPEWSRGTPTGERGSLSKMFTALTDRGETRPRAPTWGTPEAVAEDRAPGPDRVTADTPDAAGTTPEFRLSDFRMSARPQPPSAPPIEVAEPAPASPAIFGLADRLAGRSRAGADRPEPPPRPSVSGMPARPTRPAPLRRPEAGGVTTAETLFRRL